MRRLLYGLAGLVLTGLVAHAAFFAPAATLSRKDPQAAGGYAGPGDVVSGATAWYGLRCYNAAKASAAQAINVRRASDNSTQDIGLTAACALDVTAANTFAGTDATCQGSTSGLSVNMAFTSCTSTPTVGSSLSGSGINFPAYLVSCGAFVAGAGTCVVNLAQNVGVAETITLQYALYVPKWYDQSGNTSDAANATAAQQPMLLTTCFVALPCVVFVGASSHNLSGTTASLTNGSMGIVAERSGVFTQGTLLSSIFNGNSTGVTAAYNGSNVVQAYGFNASFSVTASDVVWHSMQFVFNGASSIIGVDGSNTTGSIGAGGPSTPIAVGKNPNVGNEQYLTGYIGEAGYWGSTYWTTTQIGNICHNQYLYWGTSVSC